MCFRVSLHPATCPQPSLLHQAVTDLAETGGEAASPHATRRGHEVNHTPSSLRPISRNTWDDSGVDSPMAAVTMSTRHDRGWVTEVYLASLDRISQDYPTLHELLLQHSLLSLGVPWEDRASLIPASPTPSTIIRETPPSCPGHISRQSWAEHQTPETSVLVHSVQGRGSGWRVIVCCSVPI